MEDAPVSESEQRLAGLIAVLGIDRLAPVLDRMDPKEAFLIRQLAYKKVPWEVVETSRRELAEQLQNRKDEGRFDKRGDYYA